MGNFFKKLADLFDGGTSKEGEEMPAVIANVDKGSDAVTNRIAIIQKIVGKLLRIYRGSDIVTDDKTLLIWFTDALLCDSLLESDFKNQLYSAIENETDLSFSDIILRKDNPTESDSLSLIDEGISISVKTPERRTVTQNTKARIATIDGRGFLCQEEYILDSEKILSNPSFVYNIGAGVSPDTQGGGYRVNHIAIDDSIESPQYEKNRYVSRAHAHIGYKTGYGFILCVEHGGTRMAGKRTRIIRGGTPIEVDNIMAPVPLIDGDFIELGKSVVLQYNELKN